MYQNVLVHTQSHCSGLKLYSVRVGIFRGLGYLENRQYFGVLVLAPGGRGRVLPHKAQRGRESSKISVSDVKLFIENLLHKVNLLQNLICEKAVVFRMYKLNKQTNFFSRTG